MPIEGLFKKKGSKTIVMEQLPMCDFCRKKARYDGRTWDGAWSYMCPTHFKIHGVGLGLGKGQKIVTR